MNVYTPENFDDLLIAYVNENPKREICHNKSIDLECCSDLLVLDFIVLLQRTLEEIPESHRAQAIVSIDDGCIDFLAKRIETDDEHIERCETELARQVNAKKDRWLTYQLLKREFERDVPGEQLNQGQSNERK